MATRPTVDRVKEALFNLLGNKVIGARFLDLFAGAGGIGIEALSRGAAQAVFIEISPRAVRVIRENLLHTGLADRAEVHRQEAVSALDNLGKSEQVFDLIYVDPPYLKGYEEKVLEKINKYGLMDEKGILVVESSKKDTLPEHVGQLTMVRREKYGDTLLNFYRRHPVGYPKGGTN
jgi:16S rRNA (guanine(966)-N(2))-methyltransferase RsmD